MAKDSVLQRAEEHMKQNEAAGITYATAEGRNSAVLALAQAMELEAREEAISPASAASEGGNTLATAGGERSLQEIDSQLSRLRQGPRNTETQKKIQALNAQKDAIRQPSGDDLITLLGG